jgi:hypothetical protein
VQPLNERLQTPASLAFPSRDRLLGGISVDVGTHGKIPPAETQCHSCISTPPDCHHASKPKGPHMWPPDVLLTSDL